MSTPIEFGAKRSTFTIPVSREILLDHGLAEPTPQERAEMDRAAAESRRREAERAERLAAARVDLAALTDPLTRTVLDLHVEDQHGECVGCDFAGYDAERPDWPCRTVEAVAAHHGIAI